MTNQAAKKLAIAEARGVLERQERELRYRLADNRWQQKKLAESSAVAKRELGVLLEMIRHLDGKPPKVNKKHSIDK